MGGAGSSSWLLFFPFLGNFRPERVLFRPCGVNLRACLCGVPVYASAQSLDFLAWTKNPSFPNRKLLVFHPELPDGNEVCLLRSMEAGLQQRQTYRRDVT
jgi:hypothetical protein